MRQVWHALVLMLAHWQASYAREKAYRARKREIDEWVETVRGQFYRSHLDLWDGHRPE